MPAASDTSAKAIPTATTSASRSGRRRALRQLFGAFLRALGYGTSVQGARAGLVVSLVASLAAGASAQTEEEAAAMNLQLAVDLCLRNYRTEAETVPALQAAGFDVRPSADAGSHEVAAPGVTGFVVPQPGAGYCTFQSPHIPIPTAEAIGRAVADRLFPGKVESGGPESPVGTSPAPCEGLSIFAPQRLITISYAAAGNSGECTDDGTSAIIVNM